MRYVAPIGSYGRRVYAQCLVAGEEELKAPYAAAATQVDHQAAMDAIIRQELQEPRRGIACEIAEASRVHMCKIRAVGGPSGLYIPFFHLPIGSEDPLSRITPQSSRSESLLASYSFHPLFSVRTGKADPLPYRYPAFSGYVSIDGDSESLARGPSWTPSACRHKSVGEPLAGPNTINNWIRKILLLDIAAVCA